MQSGAVAQKLRFLNQPNNATIGLAFSTQPVVSIEDAYGNRITSGVDSIAQVSINLSAGTGTLSASGVSCTTFPANCLVTASDGLAIFSGLSLATLGTGKILTATMNSRSLSQVSNNFEVKDCTSGSTCPGNPTFAAPVKVVLTLNSNSTMAGSSLSLTATIKDISNLTVTNYTGTLHFTSSDSNASLPANYTFSIQDKGIHIFTAIKLKSAGSHTVTAQDLSAPSITGISDTISVSASLSISTLSLAVVGKSSAVADGTTITTLQATVQDIYLNPISLQPVFLSLPSDGGSAIIMGLTDSFGHVDFNLTSPKKMGTYTYKVSSGALTSVGLSLTFGVGPATQLIVLQQPGEGMIQVDWPQQPILQIADSNGNPITTGSLASTAVSVSLKNDQATTLAVLGGTTTVNASQGRVVFKNLNLNLEGTAWQLIFSASGFPNEADLGTHTVSTESAIFTVTKYMKIIYVDSAANSGGTGTFESPNSNLQSVINQVSGTDETHIKLRGGIYQGPFSINNKTTPLFIEPYGSEKAAIRCSRPQAGWILHQGSIYKTHVTNPVAQVFFHDQLLLKARYPTDGYIFAKAYSAMNTTNSAEFFNVAAAADLNAMGGLVDADITARTCDFWFRSGVVTSLDTASNSFQIDANRFSWTLNSCASSDYGTANCPASNHGWGFFFANKLWMLTEPGHWVFDSSSNMLYVRMPDDSMPSETDIEVAEESGCFKVFNSANLNLNNLTIKNSGAYGLYAYNSSQLTFDKLNILNSKSNGIFMDGRVTAMRIKNTNINGTGSDAVTGNYEGSDIADSQFLMDSSTVSHAGNALGPAFTSAAISLPRGFVKAVIQNNFIHDVPYVGMILPPYSFALNNTLTDFCKTLSDCGAIYGGGRMPGATIEGNMIYNSGSASLEGKPTGYPNYNIIGIYLDDFMNNSTVRNNIVTNTPTGIFLHNAHDNLIENNVIYGFDVNGLTSQEDDILQLWSFNYTTGWLLTPYTTTDAGGQVTCYPSTTNNVFNNNKFIDSKGKYAISTSSYITPQKIAADGVSGCTPPVANLDRIKTSLTLNNNSYSTLFTNSILNSNSLVGPASLSDLVSLQIEANPINITSGVVPSFTSINQAVSPSVNFATQYPNFVTWSSASNESISNRQANCTQGSPSISGPCFQFNTSPDASSSSILISPVFASQKDIYYHLHLKVFNPNNVDVPSWISMIRNGPTYESTATAVSATNNFILKKGEWTTIDWYAVGIVNTNNLPSSRIDLELSSTGLSFSIAEFQLQAVNLTMIDFSKYTKAIINTGFTDSITASCAQLSTLGCSGWYDSNQGTVAFPVSVPPRSIDFIWHGL